MSNKEEILKIPAHYAITPPAALAAGNEQSGKHAGATVRWRKN
jgi:hypothetical protein